MLQLLHGPTYPPPAAVRDNIVPNDVTITSPLCSGVIILGINFLCFSKTSPRDGSRQKITKLYLHLLKLCRKKMWPLFSGHGVCEDMKYS